MSKGEVLLEPPFPRSQRPAASNRGKPPRNPQRPINHAGTSTRQRAATATGLGPWPRRQPQGLGSPGWPQRQPGILSAFSRHLRRSPPRFSGNSVTFFLGSRFKRRLLLSILQLTRSERRRWPGWHKGSSCEGSYDEPSRSVDGFGNHRLRCRSSLPARFTNNSCATARLTSST